MAPGEVFVRQSGPLTCVAACVTMLRRRRGVAADEATVIEEWGAPPFTLAVHAASDGDYASVDPDDPASLELLRARVASAWVVVLVMQAPRQPAHAIVLTEVTPAGFRYLDPAEPGEEQPFELDEVALARAWTGYMLVAPG